MDNMKAIKWLRQAAEEGNARAQFRLGLTYAQGKDIAKNEAEAVYWWKRSATNENRQAQYCLGIAYEYGIGAERNKRPALSHYEQAYKRGSKFDRNVKFGPKYRTGSRLAVSKTGFYER